jgi:hypothetical protein
VGHLREHRFTALVAVAGVMALAASGCSGSSDAAAITVNGHEFSRSSVDRELAAIAASPRLKSYVTGKNGSPTASITARWLTGLVEAQAAENEVARKHLRVTKDDRDIAGQRARQLFGNASVFTGFPKWFRDLLSKRYAAASAVVRSNGDPPTDAQVRAQYDKSIAESCASGRFVSHILVAGEEEANAIAAQLAAGADFGQLAAQRSTDTASAQAGGALGCLDGQQLDPAFTAAMNGLPLGATSPPVKSQFGWHIIRVREIHEAVPFDSVKDGIRNDLVASSPAGQQVLRDLMAKANVKVDPTYGRWVPKKGNPEVKPRKH